MVISTRLLLSGTTFWGWLLAAVSIDRATSYLFRPPDTAGSTLLLETIVPYPVWAWILLASAVLILISTVTNRGWLIGCVGHVITLGCYGTFACSIVLGAVFLDLPWAGSGTATAVAVLNFGRLLALAGGGHSGR
jgi:hypothetical protein